MLSQDRDPIVAVATAPGRGAVGIVRISGQALLPVAQALLGRVPQPRQAHYGPFLDAHGQALDQGLALYFPAPHSFTGEDVLELQAHGGPVLLQLLVQRCLEVGADHMRLAEPGEFTRRAFLNGKMDLAQAEAVADLIEAGTERAARSAVRSLQGAFSRRIDALAQRVLHLRMLVEATLDFPEEDIDFLEQADARGQLAGLRAAVDQVLAETRQGALLREGLRVVIAGQPNVGKSSLLNALAGQDVAIVTPIAGTTRDRIEQVLQIDGVPLHVIDTAGLRSAEEASDAVERIGIERSWEAIRQADAVLLVADGSRRGQPAYDQADTEIRTQLLAHGIAEDRWVPVINKVDLEAAATASDTWSGPAGTPLRLSAKTGDGLAALRRHLLERAGWHDLPEGVALARTRHVEAVRRCADALQRAEAQANAADPALDLFAEELRLAHRALGEVTGQVSADELLGVIFSSFCIGK